MSDLEGEAKPILVPLILGQASTLSPADQQVVATWGFKTFLMLHLLDMRAWIPPAPYAWLRDRGRAPDSVRISIAKFGGRIHTGRYDITGHAPANRPAVRPQDISEYRFSFNIGLLVYAGLGNVDLKPSRGYVGSFRTKQAALARKRYVDGELAALRVPTLHVAAESTGATLRQAAARWQASRVDVSPGTAQTYRVALNRLLPRLGDVPLERLDAQTVGDLVAELHGAGLRKQTIRKTVSVLAMVLDHAGIQPNPARDKLLVKMPREERRELHPPTAAHVEAVVRLLPTRYRLPTLVLDATGMRIGELEALTWGDVDEPRQRWRVSSAVAKTGRARWIPVPDVLFEAVTALVPREDRVSERPVFQGFGGERFRTAIARACTAAGVPAFSPHDLRHRRVSLLHLGGMPWARIGELVGHDDLVTTARTYTHVVADEGELDYESMLS